MAITRHAAEAVTAAQLVKSFSLCRERANHEPLAITNHGRETHVLVGVELWDGLTGQQAAGGAPQLEPAEVERFADWLDDGIILCDARFEVVFANRVVDAICRRRGAPIAGQTLMRALPELAGTLIEVNIRRTAASGEPCAADMPSPFVAGAWLRTQTFPLGPLNVIVLRDISEDAQRHRMADVKAAILEAMLEHGGIGYVRLSMGGTVERVEGGFSEMIGLTSVRLDGVSLFEVADRAYRTPFRAAINAALRDNRRGNLAVGFMTNDGAVRVFKTVIVPLHGAYGAEGCICLLTPESPGGLDADAPLRF